MPAAMESIFGPSEKTHINISGRESITFAGQTLSARVDSSRRFSPGEKIRLGFNLSLASIFDKQTENRM